MAHGITAMGYKSYKQYLNGNIWKRIRKRVFLRDNKKCIVCGDAGKCVHHRSYRVRVMRGECDSMLVTLCNPCHEYIELYEDGRVVYDMEKKEVRLGELLKAHRNITLDDLTTELEKHRAERVGKRRRLKTPHQEKAERLEKELKEVNKILKKTAKELKDVKDQNVRFRKKITQLEEKIPKHTPIVKSGTETLKERVHKLRGNHG